MIEIRRISIGVDHGMLSFGLMLRSIAVLSALAWVLVACAGKRTKEGDEFANLGRSHASSEPPAGVRAPVLEGDLAAVQRRGQLLFDMDRALRLAKDRGLAEVGDPTDAVIMPVIDVDPGGKSAQVVFLSWPKGAAERKPLTADDAERWLLVSMLLEPERILGVERLSGKVVRHTGEHVHGGAILEAAKRLEQIAPGQSFTMLSVLEQAASATGLVTRVYAFAEEGDAPDVELVVAPAKGKRGAPRLVSTHTTHPPGAMEAEHVTLNELERPTPMTVARVMGRGPDAAPVQVRTRGGAWRVMPANGHLIRDGGETGS